MKTINKTFTNNEIYQLATELVGSFNDNMMYLPAAVNYSIQKNKKTLLEIATEIEQERTNIIKHYANIDDSGNYQIPQDLIDIVNHELMGILSIKQEIKIYTFKIEEIVDVQLTSAQMSSIMFMIEEE